jgi:hypothetical protein
MSTKPDVWGDVYMAPCILNLGVTWKQVVTFCVRE